MRRLLATLALVTALSGGVSAAPSEPALLVADRVVVENDTRLVAEGAVEVFHNGIRLTATRIVYDQEADQLTIEGPLRLEDKTGNLVIAESAELTRDFQDGLLLGARMVLDEQLQIASVEARRVDGRYTQMSRVALTSCQVCGDETPLWQIRATSIIHDEEAKQIYIDGAQLRFLDVPVMYLPKLRLPDPTLDRARGFLIPELRSSTLLGFGLYVPYFVPLGDHADVTVAPYVSPVTKTIELRYRQAFRNGQIEAEGAISRDTLTTDKTRAYLFAKGLFDLGRDFELTFDIEAVNDRSYLSDYSYSGKDRLDSEIKVERIKPDSYIGGALVHYESLRDNESNATLPTLVGDVAYQKAYRPGRTGGTVLVDLQGHTHYRYSDTDIIGRDVTRTSAGVTYKNRWTLIGGIRAGFETALWADHFRITQDSSEADTISQLTPSASLELRWPWVRAKGATHQLIEPVMQVGWTGGDRLALANDESTHVELDEANLLSLSRFPAADRRERGLVGAAGLRWVYDNPEGWSSGLVLGRVWRETADSDFTRSSGLQGTASDWLLAVHTTTASGLELIARGLVDADLRFSKAEIRGQWDWRKLGLGASYLLQGADAAEGRTSSVSEWTLEGDYQFTQDWSGSTSWRYDIVQNRLDRAGLGLTYANECIDVGFSVSRRYASSTNVEPTTNYGLTVALKGFSTGGSAKEYQRTCR